MATTTGGTATTITVAAMMSPVDADRPVQTSIDHMSDQEMFATTRQIVRACMRCRKKKSKCDAFRPCSVCLKAGVECVSRPANEKADESSEGLVVKEVPARPSEERPTKIRRTLSSQLVCDQERSRSNTANRHARRTPSAEAEARILDESMASVDLIEENMNTQLFTITPGHLMGSLAVQQEAGEKETESPLLHHDVTSGGNECMSTPSTRGFIDPQYSAVLPWSYSRSSAVSLLAHLPPRPVTDYLVAVYFNTVHWFMVIFHEGHFLHHYRNMMDLYARDRTLIDNTDDDFTFAVLVLTVVAMGGRYTSMHPARARRCKQAYVDFCRASNSFGSTSFAPPGLDVVRSTSRLFSVVRSNATDIIACGTLATVQSLLLLGSLYLYHGDANLAWSNSGSTVRAAHAVGLHKENSELRWASRYYQHMERDERRQLRWRLFWAVHTADRFLAMCYGLPPLINDEDCVAGIPSETNIYPPLGSSSFLMIEDDLHDMDSTETLVGSNTPTTLLTYQTYKFQFYIILGQITSTLYRQSHGGFEAFTSKYKAQRPTDSSVNPKEKSEEIVEAVKRLGFELRKWHDDIPKDLHLSEDLTYPGCREGLDEDDDEIIIPASDDIDKDSRKVQRRRLKIKNAIYGMQALFLQLSYDSALVLLHRPILAMKDSIPQEIFHQSLTACWKATMRISKIGKHHAFRKNQQSHAISFVGIHLFTAGVVLSAFASSDPMSRWAWEAKRGLNRVIKMQRRLRRKVVVSGQSLTILEHLAQEVLKKEMKLLIAKDSDDDEPIESPGIAQSNLPSNTEAPQTYVASQGAGGLDGTLQCQSSAVNLGPDHSQFAFAPLSDYPENAWDTLFEGSILEINESMLEIDKYLAESHLPPSPSFGMGFTDASMNNDFQQARLW